MPVARRRHHARTRRCRPRHRSTAGGRRGCRRRPARVRGSDDLDTMRHRPHLEPARRPRRAGPCARSRRRPPRPRAGCRARAAPAARRRRCARPSGSCPAARAPRTCSRRRRAGRSSAAGWRPRSPSARAAGAPPSAGTWPGLPSCRASAGDGSSTCASPPTWAVGIVAARSRRSCPRPTVTRTSPARPDLQVGDPHDDLAVRSCGPPVDPLARIDQR